METKDHLLFLVKFHFIIREFSKLTILDHSRERRPNLYRKTTLVDVQVNHGTGVLVDETKDSTVGQQVLPIKKERKRSHV